MYDEPRHSEHELTATPTTIRVLCQSKRTSRLRDCGSLGIDSSYASKSNISPRSAVAKRQLRRTQTDLPFAVTISKLSYSVPYLLVHLCRYCSAGYCLTRSDTAPCGRQYLWCICGIHLLLLVCILLKPIF